MACGPFKTAGQGFAWSAAALIVLSFVVAILLQVTAPPTPLSTAAAADGGYMGVMSKMGDFGAEDNVAYIKEAFATQAAEQSGEMVDGMIFAAANRECASNAWRIICLYW